MDIFYRYLRYRLFQFVWDKFFSKTEDTKDIKDKEIETIFKYGKISDFISSEERRIMLFDDSVDDKTKIDMVNCLLAEHYFDKLSNNQKNILYDNLVVQVNSYFDNRLIDYRFDVPIYDRNKN